MNDRGDHFFTLRHCNAKLSATNTSSFEISSSFPFVNRKEENAEEEREQLLNVHSNHSSVLKVSLELKLDICVICKPGSFILVKSI